MKVLQGLQFYIRINNSSILNCDLYNFEINNISIHTEEYNFYKALLEDIINSKFNSNLKSKIYLGKLSDLPRHKIKEYFNNNDIKKTSKLEQSETIILNKKYLIEFLKLFDYQSSYGYFSKRDVYIIDKEEDKKFLISEFFKPTKYQKRKLISGTKYYEDFPLLVTVSEEDKIRGIPPILKQFLSNKEHQSLYIKKLYRDSKFLEIVNIINYIKSNPNINIIFDEDFLLTLNKDGFELDEEYLNVLNNMFESRSQDNINLALEMLSNINIEKHSLTIALLLNKHNRVFSWNSGLSLNKNRSFKSIIKYFESKNIDFRSDWRSFSLNLYNLHKDNPKSVKIIQDFARQNVNNYLKGMYGPNSSFIELNSNDFKFNI